MRLLNLSHVILSKFIGILKWRFECLLEIAQRVGRRGKIPNEGVVGTI